MWILFYAVAAVEYMLIFGTDVSNAFAEAPPPKQGFYIHPDWAFHEWWIKHKKRSPLPPNHVIPILLATQGHPESTRLWEKHAEKHADAILRELGLMPTVHEPCLYSGMIDGKRIIFKRQVDDFANTPRSTLPLSGHTQMPMWILQLVSLHHIQLRSLRQRPECVHHCLTTMLETLGR